MRQFSVLFLLVVCLQYSHAFFNPYPVRPLQAKGDPLFLTPYIEQNRILEGQLAAKVKLPGSNVTSYSGFLTVNSTYNSNLFFLYFPSEIDPWNAPVVLRLQGEFGSSSLFEALSEHGAVSVDGKRNIYSLSKFFNVIYIDNPVGVGFSFTKDNAGYPNNQAEAGKDLYSALHQFFHLFPDLLKNDFYLTGEANAGKYIPMVGSIIHNQNKEHVLKINLKGLAIGNGHFDPENMMLYSDYLYQIGLVGSVSRDLIKVQEAKAVKLIQKRKSDEARKILLGILDSIDPHINYYNYLLAPYKVENNITTTLKRNFHLGNVTLQNGSIVYDHLKNDIMESVKPEVEAMLKHYRVMFYSGQLSIVGAYPMVLNFLSQLKWSGSEDYKTVPRNPWIVGDELAGFYKKAKGLTEVLVRDAGLRVHQDQPKWALDLITRFVQNKF